MKKKLKYEIRYYERGNPNIVEIEGKNILTILYEFLRRFGFQKIKSIELKTK